MSSAKKTTSSSSPSTLLSSSPQSTIDQNSAPTGNEDVVVTAATTCASSSTISSPTPNINVTATSSITSQDACIPGNNKYDTGALANTPTTRHSGSGHFVPLLGSGGPPLKPIELHHQHHYHNNMSHNAGDNRGQRMIHAQEQLSKTNLYIRGLQTSTKDQDLHDMCNRFGSITSTKAILDKATGCCRGYGFVEFVSAKSAELAVRELTKSGIQAQMAKITSSYSPSQGNNNNNNNNNHHHHHHHHGGNNHYQTNHPSNNSGYHNQANSLKPNKNGAFSNFHHHSGTQHNHNSMSLKNHADPTNLYIANLPPNMSEPELEELLSNYGNIVSTRILRDESNNPRGVGFARMESRDKCEEIIEQLNGRPYKGSSEPLVVKFADGGNKKRHHYNNHQHQHHNNNSNNSHHNHQPAHLNHHKANQGDEGRWQGDDANIKELNGGVGGSGAQNYDNHQHLHQGNMNHSNQPPDLAMMGAMRIQPAFPPGVPAGGAYGPPPIGPPSSAPHWIHPAGGQPYVVPPQMTQTGGLSPSNQAAAAAAVMHYGHIPHLAAQMQGLQITHAPAHVGGYLPPQHQWPTLWPHPVPQQSPSPMGRLSTGPSPMQPGPPPPPTIHGQLSSQMTPVQQQQQQQQASQPIHQSQQQSRLTSQQQQRQSTVIDNKLHVTVPL